MSDSKKSRRNPWVLKVRNFTSHPNFVKFTKISQGALDIAFKIVEAKNNPLVLIPSVGSLFNVINEAIGGNKDGAMKTMLALGATEFVDENLGSILWTSGLLKHFETDIVAKDDAYMVWRISLNEGDIYAYKYNTGENEISLYTHPGKEYLLDKLIQECFRHIGGMGAELTAVSQYGAMVARQIAPVFTDHNIGEQLALANTIYRMRVGKESPAYVFYGPPGTGKTTFAIAIAELLNLRVLMIGPQSINSIQGKTLMDVVNGLKPGLIILDDIDKAPGGTQLLYTALNNIRNQYKELAVIVTTNSLKKLGNAFLRPGRGGEIIHFKPPTLDRKKEILELYLKDKEIINLIAPKIESTCTHDWVSYLGKQLQGCITMEQMKEVVNKTNEKFRIVNVDEAGADPEDFDYPDDL